MLSLSISEVKQFQALEKLHAIVKSTRGLWYMSYVIFKSLILEKILNIPEQYLLIYKMKIKILPSPSDMVLKVLLNNSC